MCLTLKYSFMHKQPNAYAQSCPNTHMHVYALIYTFRGSEVDMHAYGVAVFDH